MKNLANTFRGEHGDFSTLFHDCDLEQFVIRYFHDPGGANEFPYFKVIIGFTSMDNGDVMLHLVDAEGVDNFEELERAGARHGVEFRMLSDIMKDGGFAIYPGDQLEDEGEDEDEDEEPCVDGDCEDCGLCSAVDDDDEFCLTPKGRAEADDYDLYDGDEDAAAADMYALYTDEDDTCLDCPDCSDIEGCRLDKDREMEISPARRRELRRLARTLTRSPFGFMAMLAMADALDD